MPTYEEKIKEFALNMPNNSIKVLLDLDDKNFLGLVVKNTVEKIQSVRNTRTITTPYYMPQINSLVICIHSISQSKEDGVIIPIQLGNKQIEQTLIGLATGLGHIDVYYASNDLNTVWSTQILRDPNKRIGLKLELEKAKLL